MNRSNNISFIKVLWYLALISIIGLLWRILGSFIFSKNTSNLRNDTQLSSIDIKSNKTNELYYTPIESFKLHHSRGRSMLFCRSDPRSILQIKENMINPPRNGAILKGRVVEISNMPEGSLKWLDLLEYKQKDENEFVTSHDCFLPFDQDGKIIFPIIDSKI